MKKSYLFIIILFASISIFAQPSITGALMPTPWDITDLHPADTAFINHGPAGANQTWDFSTMSVHFNPQGYYYYPPAFTSYDSAFPTATVALEIASNLFNYYFYQTSPAGYVLLGEWSDIWELPYSDTKQVLTFPFTFNSTVTDTYGGVSAPYSGTTTKTLTGNFTTTADAYGTLILPVATHTNVLRLKTVDHYSETYTGIDPTIYDIIRYEWYDCINKFPLLSIVSISQTVDTSATTLKLVLLSTFAAGIEEQAVNKNEISIYPNPAVETTHLSLNLIEKSKVEISVFNNLGQRIIRMPSKEYNSGTFNEELNLSELSKGNYFIRVKINDFYLLEKLIIQ